ncbi:MAG: metalloregulator ArsR/SmtB family transcription factor [Kiritimatiellales bacterium]|nr:metalloregulator ArsR/SmtB family transcription factor [Kiritimatiellales bacterium]
MTNLQQLERIYKAVANNKRLYILTFIKKSHSATVSDISHAIKLKKQPTSRHLQILENAGFLVRRRRGVFVTYRLSTALNESQKKVISTL